jgi:hypothetical protein
MAVPCRLAADGRAKPRGARVMSGTFAEIRQQDATPEIATIYADIKRSREYSWSTLSGVVLRL